MATETQSQSQFNAKSIMGVGFLAGIIGIILLVVAGGAMGADSLKPVLQSYLFGWSMLSAAVLGCFGLTLLHHTVRGSWGLSVLRIFEAGGGPVALFWTAVSFLPIAMNMGAIYGKWVNPDPADALVMHKVAPQMLFGSISIPGYLTPGFFLFRFALYFLIWIVFAYFLKLWSEKEDATKDLKWRHKRTNLSAPGLVVFVLTITLASTDWFMSIDPHWFSSIFGPWYMIGGALFSLAVASAIVCANANKTPYNSVVSPGLTRDLGNLLFAICMLWIYFTLSQYLIIWSGNLPEFIIYYKERQAGVLPLVGMANVLLGWFLPWMLLLAPPMKAKPERLLFVCGILISMRFVDLYWNIIPLFGRSYPVWTDLAALLGLLGIWLAIIGHQLQKSAVLPSHDTRLQEALEHSHA